MLARPALAAFSLLELIFVLIVLAIVAAIAMPRFAQAGARQRVEAAARRIVADLDYARAQARITSQSRTVSFTPASARYELVGLDSLEHSAQGYIVHLNHEPYGASLTSADFGGKTQITFDGYGIPDSAGTIVVAVGTNSRTITLDANSGEASVQ